MLADEGVPSSQALGSVSKVVAQPLCRAQETFAGLALSALSGSPPARDLS